MIRIESEALVVRTVTYGESDVIATLVTETSGKVSTIVRGARKSTRRVGGALEPMHTIKATYSGDANYLDSTDTLSFTI